MSACGDGDAPPDKDSDIGDEVDKSSIDPVGEGEA